MDDRLKTMGERLAWARNQQGLILQQVSDRSGLAVGYISQLEKGSKQNPTIEALQRLAQALNVPISYIFGEMTTPAYGNGTATSHAWDISRRFAQHVRSMPAAKREKLEDMRVEGRFSFVVDFLCQEFPILFTHTSLAFQLGISVRALNDVMYRNCSTSLLMIQQLGNISGIPLQWFATGDPESLQGAGEMTPAETIPYVQAVAVAARNNITPRELLRLIQVYLQESN